MDKKKKPKETETVKRAATADILGIQAPAANAVPPKWRKHFRHLIELRDDLLNRKADLTKDARDEIPAYSLHMGDAGTDTYDRDYALSLISSEQNALYEIDQALNRIKSGTYGICEVTGENIELERLDAIPWTRYSTKAKRALEEGGAGDRIRLADHERAFYPETEEAEREEEED